MAALALVTAPSAAPLDVLEVKDQLRVVESADDALVDALIQAATQHVDGRDGWLGRALLTQTWDYYLDEFPDGGFTPIRLPLAPVQSITSITYLDVAGATQTWATDQYVTDLTSVPARITPAYAKIYPPTRFQVNAIRIRFVAGYGDAPGSIPQPIRLALLMLIAHWYENRQPVVPGQMLEMPYAVQALLTPFRVRTIDG